MRRRRNKSGPGREAGATEAIGGASLGASVADQPLHEPSAWLRALMARRAMQARELVGDEHRPDDLIVAPLGGPDTPGDRQCDRCEVHVPTGATLHVVSLFMGEVLLIGGLCEACMSKEVPDE